jgi:dTDP-4-dehydrorhamnose reductase
VKILILGGTGMLGHTLHRHLSGSHDVISTTRRSLRDLPVDPSPFFERGDVLENTDATDVERLAAMLADLEPEAVINGIGAIKQREEANDPSMAIRVNALFPHLAAEACRRAGARLVHMSTDCVFSGDRGDYREGDTSDARDLYGRTKYLGEVGQPALTLRTSIIGRELDTFASFVEWFLSQHGVVPGFTRAIYTGVTTAELARIIEILLIEHADMDGLYQVAAEKITKFDLLRMIRDRIGPSDVTLQPDGSFVCDRSLVGERFVATTGIRVASWAEMIHQLATDAPLYEGERR